MNHSRQHRYVLSIGLVVIMAASLLATTVSLTLLYNESLRSQRERLADTVQSIARFVEAIHRHERDEAAHRHGEPLAHTMAQLLDAHGNYGGFGETGEFLIAHRQADQIEYLLAPRHARRALRIPWDAPVGEPMRRALQGQRGTAILSDYRGTTVLAAYLPLPEMGLGLVAKIDLAEIRTPFIAAAAFATFATLLLALAAVLLFRRATSPLISAIEENERHFRALFDLSPFGVLIIEPGSLRVLDFNPAAREQFGYTQEEFARLALEDLVAEKDGPAFLQRTAAELQQRGALSLCVRGRRSDGAEREFQVRARAITSGARPIFYVLYEDVTEQHSLARELEDHRRNLAGLVHERTAELEHANVQLSQEIATRRAAEARLQLADVMFRTTDQGVFVTDAQGTILRVNPAFCAITGYDEAEAIGNNPRMLKSDHQGPEFYKRMWEQVLGEGRWVGRLWNRRKNGEAYFQQLTITLFRDADDRPANYVAVFSDITDLHQKERHIEHQAYHDALTDLPNRLLFHDRLAQALHQADRSRERLAVMFLDLDRFKMINDTLGHNRGDQLLQAVAARLTAALRQSDTVSRFGGDEFVILAAGVDDPAAAEQVVRNVLHAFSHPFTIDGHDLTVSPSLGVALFPDDGSDVATLLKNADAAMYRAKELGRSQFQFYTPDMNARALADLTLENDLRRAIAGGELEVHYQPRVGLPHGRILGMEALVRWRHPTRGLVSPAEFIPVAEESGLIVPLGMWVLEEACRQTRQWQLEGHDLRISVNISARQFNQPDLLRKVDEVLAATGLAGERLELELTESLVMQQPENTIEILAAMKRRGIWIAIDDFGTGYSSLNYLKRFPIDILKIDRSFIRDIHVDPDAAAIAETIAALGHSLRMEVIAEGVETGEQLCFLRDRRCDAIQGYLFSPPVPPERFIALVREGRRLDCRAAQGAAATGS